MRPRISKDDLEYCVKSNTCYDCYREEKDVQAVISQRRRKFEVPCCQKHFDDYVEKVRQAWASKYARHCERTRKAGLCSSYGCQSKLIPRELLPPHRRGERTCGQHGAFKAFQITRIEMIQFIMDHCLTPEQRKNAKPQNIIYKPGYWLVFVGIQYPNGYLTQVWLASDLERRIKESHSQRVFGPAQSGAIRQNTK